MSPFGIGIDQALNHLGQTFKALESFALRVSTGKKVHAPREDSMLKERVHQGSSAFRRLQAINAKQNFTAMNVRVADQIMDTVGKYLEEMKAQLERIIKNFPPFPPGSEERVRILRSYSALRKQIDQMAFPRKDQGMTKIIVNSTKVIETKDSKDLRIPELPETATDQEIAAAIESLEAAKKTLHEGRAKLATEVLKISHSEVAKNKVVELNLGDRKEFESDLSECAAELKSQELEHILRIESTRGLTETPSQFVDLLE